MTAPNETLPPDAGPITTPEARQKVADNIGLTAALKTVREKGLGPPQARAATQQQWTTPAIALAAPEAAPPLAPSVSPQQLSTEAPATSKAIQNNPITAATVGANDETLEHMLGIEKAARGDLIKPGDVKKYEGEPEEEENLGFTDAGRRMWGAFKGASYALMRDLAGIRLFLGQGEADLQLDPANPYNEDLRAMPNVFEKDMHKWQTLMDVEDAKLGELTFPEKVAQSIPGLVPMMVGAWAFGPVGGASAAGVQNLGSAYLHFRELPDVDGKPLPPDIARGAAMISALANGALFYGGEKAVVAAFGGLIEKAGGKAAAGKLVEGAITRALASPLLRNRLLQVGKAGLHSETALELYSLAGELIQGEMDYALQSSYVEGAPENPERPTQAKIWSRALDAAENVRGVGFLLGATPATHLALRGKLAENRARSYQYQDQGLPAELALAQGEAGKNPAGLKDPISEIQKTHNTFDTSGTRAYPPEMLRLMQTEDGAKFEKHIDDKIDAGLKSGQEVVVSAADSVTIKAQPGADRLAPHERVGDVYTKHEEEQLKPLLEKIGKEKDPVEEDTKKIVNHLMTQQKFAGKIKQQSLASAVTVAEGLRVAEVERAQQAGEEPKLWDAYMKAPLEVPSGAENARLAFGKSVSEITKDAQKQERRKGTQTQKAEEEARAKEGKPAPSAPIERIRKAAAKTLGETFSALRVKGEEGQVYLSEKQAPKDAELERVRLTPADILDASTDGKLNIGPVAPERVTPFERLTKTDVKPWGIRGYIERFKDAFRVTLTGKADQSTFVHEAAHYLVLRLEEMLPSKLAAFDEWLGHKTGTPYTEAEHEQMAQGMEQFFREGHAPNAGLIPVFDTLAHWFQGVYDSMDKVGVPLTPEVRQQFTRLFALQEEVDIAGRALGLDASRLEEGIITPEERLKLRDLESVIKAKALQRAFSAAGRWERSKVQQEMNVYRAMAAADVTGNEANNIYNWLRTGDRLDGQDTGLDWVRLNYDAVRALGFDPESPTLNKIVEPKSKPLEGYDPTYLAPHLGVPDGQALMEMLSRVEPDFQAQAKRIAEERFGEDHPGYAGTDEYVKTQGELAIHNKQLELYHKELMKIIAKRLQGKADPSIMHALDRTARDQVRDATVAELRPDIAFRAQTRELNKVYEAIGKSDWEGAWEASQKAYLAMEKYKLLMEERENFRERLAPKMKMVAEDTGTRARMAKGHPEYLTVADWFLQGMKFHEEPKVTQRETRDALQKMYDRGENFPWRNQWDNQDFFDDWRAMPQEEAKSAMEAVQALQHMAGLRGEILAEGKRIGLREFSDQLVSDLLKNMPEEDLVDPETIQKDPRNANVWEKWRKMRVSLRKPEPTISIYDGGDWIGPWKRKVLQPVFDAYAERGEALKMFAKELGDLAEKRMLEAPEGKETFRKRNATVVRFGNRNVDIEQMLTVLGNWGDSRNQDILLRGMEETYLGGKAKIEDFLARGLLTKGDFEYVNGLHKVLQKLWDPLQRTREKEFGLKPDPVPTASDTFMTPQGPVTLDGGYWPTSYDYKRAGLPEKQEMVSLFHPDGNQAGMANQMVQTRSEQGLPIPLKLNIIDVHRNINQSLNYIHMYDALTNMKKVFDDPAVKDAIVRKRGWDEYENWQGYIKAMARAEQTGYIPGMEQWSSMTKFLRGMATAQYLGFRLTPGLHMLTGIPAALETVDLKDMRQALTEAFSVNPKSWWDDIGERSLEVKNVLNMKDTTIPEKAIVREIDNWAQKSNIGALNDNFRTFLKDYMLVSMKIGQSLSAHLVYRSAEIWMERRIAAGEFEGVKSNTPEAEKLAHDGAESVVRNAHGSNELKDLAPFFRNTNTVWGAFAVVAGYMNNVFNHIERQGYFFTRGDYNGLAKSIAFNMVMASILASVFRGQATSSDPKDQARDWADPEKWKWVAANAGRSVSEQYLGSIPLFGDLARFGIGTALQRTNLKDKIHMYGGTPGIIGPAYHDIEKLATHGGDAVNHAWKGSDRWGADLHKMGHDVLDLSSAFYPGTHALSSGMKVLEHAWQGDFKFNDIGDWYNVYQDPRDPLAGTKYAKKRPAGRKNK